MIRYLAVAALALACSLGAAILPQGPPTGDSIWFAQAIYLYGPLEPIGTPTTAPTYQVAVWEEECTDMMSCRSKAAMWVRSGIEICTQELDCPMVGWSYVPPGQIKGASVFLWGPSMGGTKHPRRSRH